MADILNSRFVLRRDAIYMKTESGIMFRTRKGAFAIAGKTIYSNFQKLLPYLDGACTGSELLQSMGRDENGNVAQLLKTLVQREVLQLAETEGIGLLPSSVRQTFSSQLEFIRHYANKPYERFASFREKRILVMGAGAGLMSASVALLRNGLRTLHVCAGAEDDLSLLHRQCEELQSRGVQSSIVLTDHADLTSRLEFEIVLYCSEQPDLSVIKRLNAGATQYGYYFLPAIIYAGSMIVGPIVDPLQPGCWECAMLHWSNNVGGDVAATLWRHIARGNMAPHTLTKISEVSAHMLGNTAALELFKLSVGHPQPESRSQLLKQDLSTLELAIKTLLPHPDCTACLQVQSWTNPEGPSETVSTLNGVPVSESAVRAWLPYLDEEFGTFQHFDDENIEQIPLRLSVVDFCIPLIGAKNEARHMSAVGISLQSSDLARINALKKAIHFKVARFASSSLRRLSPAIGTHRQLPFDEIESWLGGSLPEGVKETYFDCTDLHTSDTVLVPAAALHPDFDMFGRFDAHSAGIGVETTTNAALREAVLSAYEYVTIAGLVHECLKVKRWNPNTGELPATTQYLVSTTTHLGIHDWEIFIAEPEPRVYTAILVFPGQRICAVADLNLGTGFALAEAVNAVLAQHIARAQMAHSKREWVDVPLRTGFYSQADFPLHISPDDAKQESGNAVTVQQFAADLRARNKALLWRDVTPPEIQMTRSFQIVKVLLAAKRS